MMRICTIVTAKPDCGCDQAMDWNPPPPHLPTQTFNCQYLSHFSTDSAETLHDCSLGVTSQVHRVKTVIVKCRIILKFAFLST